ncbi:alpha/beta fold hydrolase [Pedobacter mendelii]|uniref:Oxidoreductase n=2 Tax=Pedobacter mendelii TaxID=1908240 RepID=A0ABQ2BKZ2_9SPHI|nr:oxidoreductase [Pedobacter mendelii]
MLVESLLFIWSTPANAQQYNDMETHKIAAYAPINGIKMFYEVYGDGEIPLILIHGGGSTIETSFGNLIPLLADYGKIIAVELQAHGRTSDRDAPETFEQDADDVAALIKYLKIEKANILGFSNGGTTTLRIAIRHPEIVNKIVAISAAYKRDGLISGFFEEMQHASLDNMPEPLKKAYLKVNPNQNGLKTMFEKDKNRMINFKDYSNESIKSIKAKTLFIVANKDVITVEHTVKMSQLIPNAQLTVLPGIHGSCIGEVCTAVKGSKMPEATSILIKEFLKE